MIFEIHATKFEDGDTKVFSYDNMSNVLKDADGNIFEYPEDQRTDNFLKPYKPFDKNRPLKKAKLISTLKIQMGLSCNYSCDYCSQKFVERQPETSKKDIDVFLEKLENLHFDEDVGLKIEIWGGEPFVYWKTMKPLVEAIAEKFDGWKTKPQFSVITNGSILTEEIIDWLMMMDFSVSISHDGPGQFVRGPDPFDDPEQKERILGFYRMMTRLGKGISFNSMLSAKNQSRKEIRDWFVNLTGDENVNLGEGSLVDAYDEDGISNSLPQMYGFQAAGSAPLVKGKPVLKPETIATAIRIGNPASWDQAIEARDKSGGVIDSVTDKEILAAYALVAGKEGVFVEPSSAAGIAGLIKYKKAGKLPKGKKIVITVTGHGLKDISWALEKFAKPKIVKVNAAAAAKALGLK